LLESWKQEARTVSNTIRFPNAGFATVTAAQPLGGARSTSFASRLGAVGASIGSGLQAIGRTVVQAAMGGLPPVVQNLAQNAVSAMGGPPLTAEQAEKVDMVDKAHLFLMQNAIFAAANAPVVERD
jgi:hypothetical protein